MWLKNTGLRNKNGKIKKEIEKLFNKPIIVFQDDMDKFEDHEMKKIRAIIGL